MSPESITKNQYSTKSDVWSFGVTIIEIWTQKIPYPELSLFQVVSSIQNVKNKFEFSLLILVKMKINSLVWLQKEY